MKEQKKAQDGFNAAILVAIIAGLIILYIIFLPISERESLIGGGKTSSGGGGDEKPNILLKVFPGTLSTSQGVENEKKLSNIFLVETTNAKELETINPFIIRNGWFDKKTKIVDFSIEDKDNTDNVLLTLTAKQRSEILTIKLNNAVIFENELASDIIEPVKLDKSLLAKTNSLEFSVSPVGYRFWTTNEYSIENIKIIGDITDTSRQESTNIFTLSAAEFSSMDKAVLKFIPYCKSVNDVGALDIFINSKKLFSSVPVCDSAYRQDVPKSALNEGENNIIFKTKKGSYSVEQIKISLDFKEPKVKTYFFEINSSTLNDVRKGRRNVVLTIKFVDGKSQKTAKLDVNGNIENLDTTKAVFSRVISTKISEGNNYVRLEPLEDMEIVELSVELT